MISERYIFLLAYICTYQVKRQRQGHVADVNMEVEIIGGEQKEPPEMSFEEEIQVYIVCCINVTTALFIHAVIADVTFKTRYDDQCVITSRRTDYMIHLQCTLNME